MSENKNFQAAGGAATTPGPAAARDKNDVAHRIGLLENRLDGVMVNFNATLSTNSAIRKEVDHLVQERAGFNDMIARLQKKGTVAN